MTGKDEVRRSQKSGSPEIHVHLKVKLKLDECNSYLAVSRGYKPVVFIDPNLQL